MRKFNIKIKKTIISVLLISSVFCVSIPKHQVVEAKTLSQLKNERDQLAKKSADAKKQLESLKKDKASVQEEIDALDKVIQTTQNELDKAQEDLNEVTKRLEQSKIDLEKAIEERDKQFEVFKKRIKYLHENGTIGYLEIVLKAESFSDALLRMQYVQDIMNYDKELLAKLEENQKLIEKKTMDIEEEQEEAKVILDEQQKKMNELDSIMAQKSATIKSYEQNEAKYEQLIASNEKASKQVEQLINQAMASSGGSSETVYTGGKLNWPVPARSASSSSLSSGFVSRNRPIGKGTEFHTGYDIPAPYGSNIVAAEGGRVIYSGWMSGYGYTIMIDHGGGLVTLYGHNSKLVVSKGTTVTRGQVVAKCGSTGNSTGNHCHFEVRLNGKAVSPEPYLGVKNISS